MVNPYTVLGVSENASDDEIKAAYRELAKKYHPDNYVNNPLADLAAEKMKEINEAYEQVQKSRRGGASSSQGRPRTSYSGNSGGYTTGSGYESSFADVRRLINSNRISEADELLDGTPAPRRDAEWYFLKGSVFYTRGWLEESYNYFSKAVQMNPNNPEYTAALNQMMWQRNTGNNSSYQGPYRTTGSTPMCTPCDFCTSLMCANCLCDCFGNGCC